MLVAGGAIFKADDKKAVVAELIGNAPHKLEEIQAGDNHSGPAGAASSFEDDACPDA